MKFILGLILGLVVGFWLGQNFGNVETQLGGGGAGETSEAEPAALSTPTDSTSDQSNLLTTPTSTAAAEPITIDSSVLSSEQAAVLKTFGIDTDTIELTADMIACAEEALGAARINEIITGATPSFAEGLTLFTCYQEN